MDITVINEKKLSNGMTRGEYLDKLNREFTQLIIDYPPTGAREWRDVPYGDHERNKLDIYLPEGKGPFPVIFQVHGGAWFMGGKSDFGISLSFPYLKEGYALVSVGYRLAQHAVFPEPVEDVVRAIDFVAAHSAQYNIDTSRMGIQGGSAGALIACLAALWSNPIKACLLRCSILDFRSISKQYAKIGLSRARFAPPELDTSVEALFMGGTPDEIPDMYDKCDPRGYVTENCPYFYLLHGLVDVDTPYLQSVEFVEAVRDKCGAERAQLYLMPNTGHDNGMYDYAYAFQSQVEFFDRRLKNA